MRRIIFFGTYDVRNTQRVQVLMEGLHAHGIEVVECNVPLGISTADRVAILRQPWRLPLLLLRLTSCWLQLILKRRNLPACDAVVVGHLGQFDVRLARILFRKTPIILDYMISGSDTAKDRRVTNGWKHALLIQIDEGALRAADIVAADTEEHRQNLPQRYRSKGVVVNVGAPSDWFSHTTAAKTPRSKQTKIVFFGAYTPLQGAPTIAKALSLTKSPLKVSMIGSGQDFEETQRLSADSQAEIEWIDWVDAAKLPNLVAQYDICLGIFGTGPKAHRVVPNKVYQGAAAGCAIITSDTEPQKRIFGDAAYYVQAGDYVALATALDTLASHPEKIQQLQTAATSLANDEFTPKVTVVPLLEHLKSYQNK